MMKSYTDINQSKKLAEILPIDSADMTWCNSSIKGINYTDSWHAELKTPIEIETIFNKAFGSDWKTWWSIIPCWSLAALLDVLPKGTRLLKSATDDTYHCDCHKGNIDKWYDNSVAAAVEMIYKLKEKDLL